MDRDLKAEILQLEGPIVVTGATGFIGAALLRALCESRQDAYGFIRESGSWRETEFPAERLRRTATHADVIIGLEEIQPKTIFNLAAYGAYSFQESAHQIFEANFHLVREIAAWAAVAGAAIVQAGSSSEYGWNSEAPDESAAPKPNSLYAISKVAAGAWLEHQARLGVVHACNLRLYSVYGPGEDPSRFIPALLRAIDKQSLPPFSRQDVSRDFVYIDDVVSAFIRAGNLVWTVANLGTFNICTGDPVTMREVAELLRERYQIREEPVFGSLARAWDLANWYGDPTKSAAVLGWRSSVDFREGLEITRSWYLQGDRRKFLDVHHSARSRSDAPKDSIQISAVIACYRDAEAIPFMYRRLVDVFEEMNIGFEIIFVNDASPDNAEEVLLSLTRADARVVGISHSRNFGSQSAFLSGMRIARGAHVVLLDGDLQDPPEVIPIMWRAILSGYDVAFGRRVHREASWIMNRCYKSFYRVFEYVAPFKIPRDAGDFSLMKREVVDSICEMPERDLFIRAQRAYVGFKQVGIDYVRPERMFGKTTNSIGRNLGWATRGVLAVSRAPLTALSIFALGLFLLSSALILLQVIAKVLFPSIAPQGLAFVSILVVGLGSLNLLAVAIVGEYVGRILEESKRRPRYIRRALIRNGDKILNGSSEGSVDGPS